MWDIVLEWSMFGFFLKFDWIEFLVMFQDRVVVCIFCILTGSQKWIIERGWIISAYLPSLNLKLFCFDALIRRFVITRFHCLKMGACKGGTLSSTGPYPNSLHFPWNMRFSFEMPNLMQVEHISRLSHFDDCGSRV